MAGQTPSQSSYWHERPLLPTKYISVFQEHRFATRYLISVEEKWLNSAHQNEYLRVAYMAVPDYQSLMLPLLRILGDEKEHALHEVKDTLIELFSLTREDELELLPSGKQRKLDNRISWARTYMKKAGLLEYTGRGKFRITKRGYLVLMQDPTEINAKFLRQFPEFLNFQKNTPKYENSK